MLIIPSFFFGPFVMHFNNNHEVSYTGILKDRKHSIAVYYIVSSQTSPGLTVRMGLL